LKKAKGSKAKTLFEQKEETDIMTGETPDIQNQVTEEMPAELASILDLEVGETGNRIEFEEGEKVPVPEKLSFKPLVHKDPWQQAFVDENTILIKRTVRSGQSIQFDGNVVVLGDVNPGSEIVASGNIIVMGALRGVVHAGATGNKEATVSAFKLQPTQLRIANHITRAPDGDYLSPDHPETARIKDGIVVIEVYQLGQDRQTKIC